MPRQNRLTPFGELISVADRGTLMGNRGVLHDDAGTIRRCDARRLVITGYGAVLSYLSDAPLVGSLLGEDPTSPEALAVEQEHIVDLFRHALLV